MQLLKIHINVFVSIYKNGMQLRKENDLKSQKLATYFENTLNNWGELVKNDIFHSQYSYLKKYDDLDVFKYEDLIKSWHPINEYLSEIQSRTIRYYTDPDWSKIGKKNLKKKKQ